MSIQYRTPATNYLKMYLYSTPQYRKLFSYFDWICAILSTNFLKEENNCEFLKFSKCYLNFLGFYFRFFSDLFVQHTFLNVAKTNDGERPRLNNFHLKQDQHIL